MRLGVVIISFAISFSGFAQNTILAGRILFLNSNKTPAVRIKISDRNREANEVYSLPSGQFALSYPNKNPGERVELFVDTFNTDYGIIEIVNKEILHQTLTSVPDITEIIICKKGARDATARKLYGIIKTSSERILSAKQKQLDSLLSQSQKNYALIANLSNVIQKMQVQTDSLTLYNEALQIASINKDKASDRVLKYISLLESGESIQIAREILSIDKALKEMRDGIIKFNDGLEELEERSKASLLVFDYDDAIKCIDSIVKYAAELHMDNRKIAEWNIKIGDIYDAYGDPRNSLFYLKKGMTVWENQVPLAYYNLSGVYNRIGGVYSSMSKYDSALYYANKALAIDTLYLSPTDYRLIPSYSNIATFSMFVGDYAQAVRLYQFCLSLYDQKDPKMAMLTSKLYTNWAGLLTISGNYKGAIYLLELSKNIDSLLETNDPTLMSSVDQLTGVYSALATNYNYINKPGEALLYQKIYLDRLRIKYKIDNIHTASAFNLISTTYNLLGQYDTALSYGLRALKIDTSLALCPDCIGKDYETIGLIYFNLEELPSALKYYLLALNFYQINSNDTTITLNSMLMNIGTIYFKMANYTKAQEYYARAIKFFEKGIFLNKEAARAYDNISRNYKMINDTINAEIYRGKYIRFYESIVPETDTSLIPVYWDAILYYRSIDSVAFYFKKALKICTLNSLDRKKDADELSHSISLIYLLKGKKDFRLRNFVNSLNNFDSVLKYTYNVEAINYKGLCLYNLHKYSEAVQIYSELLFCDSSYIKMNINNNIGLAYVKNGQMAEAKEAFRKFQEQKTDLGRAYRNWAVYYALNDDREMAIMNLELAINNGYNDIEWITNEDSLKLIRKDVRYKELITKIINK